MIFRQLWEWLSLKLDRRNRFLLRSSPSVGGQDLFWFHAASAGEWESLRPLAVEWLKRDGRVGISFFSESAKKFAEGFLASLSKEQLDRVSYCGSSPQEQGWRQLLREYRPKVCISNRYEAWPSLWAALSDLCIPLALVNAEPRSSLVWVRRALALFNVSQPRLIFFAISREAELSLLTQFSEAQTSLAGDPRLERMEERKKIKNVRAEALKEEIFSWKKDRKLLIVGNAWEVDLKALSPIFTDPSLCLLVVPHDLGVANLDLLSRIIKPYPSLRMCAEYGVLAELYALADLAYVGGGFGKGIHSVIEPAAYGVSIVAGSHRAETFSETRWLRESGQLRLAERPQDVAPLILRGLSQASLMEREKFLEIWREKLGATEVILERIQSLL